MMLGAALWLASFGAMAWAARTVAQRGAHRRPWPLPALGGLVVGWYVVVLMTLALCVARAFRPWIVALALTAAASAIAFTLRRGVGGPAGETRGPRLRTLVPLAVPLMLFTPYLLRSMVNPPRAWDALTYHLVRAANWAQAGGFAPTPAPDHWTYYAFYAPAGDLLYAWTFLAGAGDSLLFVVYALTQGLLLLATFGLARTLGARTGDAVLAAAYMGTVPAVLHFSAVGYVDNLVVALMLAFCAFAARAARAARADTDLVLAALALGSAAVIKNNAITLLGLHAALAAWLVRRGQARASIQLPAAALMLAPALLWAGYVWHATGSPFYPVGIGLGPPAMAQGNELWRGLLGGSATRGALRYDNIPAFVREQFVGTRARDHQHTNLGLGAAVVLILGAAAFARAVRRWRRFRLVPTLPVLALLFVVAVIPVAGVFSPKAVVLRTWWSPVTGRLVLPTLGIAACLIAARRDPRSRWVLLGAMALTLVQAVPIGFRPDEVARAPMAVALGLLLLGLITAVSALTGRARALIVVALALWCFAVVALDRERARFRYLAYDETGLRLAYDGTPVPIRDQPAAWKQLDGERPTVVAYVAGYTAPSYEWFRYPLFGRHLQNRVLYVSPRRDGQVPETWRGRSDPATLDADVWAARLRREGVQWVMLANPAPEEALLVRDRPDLFETVLVSPAGAYLLARPRPVPGPPT